MDKQPNSQEVKTIFAPQEITENRYFNSIKIFSFLFLILASAILSSFIIIYFFQNLQKTDGAAIDASGRNRMLSQRIGFYAEQIMNKINVQDELQIIISLHDTSFYALKYGGIAPGIANDRVLPAASEKVLPAVEKAEKLWEKYKNCAETIVAQPIDNISDNINAIRAIECIEKEGPEMLNLNNDIVSIYVQENDQKQFQLKVILLSLLALDLIIMIFVFFKIKDVVKNRRKAEQKITDLNKILELTNKILRHDLANIFTNIKTAYEIYNDSKDEKILLEGLNKTNEGINLINQMRELGNLNNIEEKLEIIDLASSFEKLIKEYKIAINVKGNSTVLADQALESVFKNIISNAINHGKTDKIDIKIEKNKNLSKIKIIDYGKGIPDEIKSKIFDEGFKFGKTGNTGLGLYIVNQTINRYGGQISVSNNEPKGTIFEITLPSK